MCAGLEEQGAGEECAFRDDDDTAPIRSREVDYLLQGFCLDESAVVDDSEIGDYVFFAEVFNGWEGCVVKPFPYGGAVGEGGELGVGGEG